MKILRTLLSASVLAFAAFMATPAHAGLTGDSIQGAYYFPTATNLYGNFNYSVNPFTVGTGIESVLTVDGRITTNVDFGDTSLVLTLTTPVDWTLTSFNGP